MKIKFTLSILLLSFTTVFLSCSHKVVANLETLTEKIEEAPSAGVWIDENPVRNIIFIIGDGMGTAQVYSSIVSQKGTSQFLRFPYTGFSRTFSNNKYTTDSGAGGSALMTGHKVNNYHIALGPDGTEHPSFLSLAHRKGLKTGFVVTSSVLDATPATTYGHVPDRKMKDTLSMQMATCGFDVMIGGERKHFLPENRHDGKSPLDTLKARGYNLVENLADLPQSQAPLCALLTEDNPGRVSERGSLLAQSTRKAIQLLDEGNRGFVLMVEGSQIDWACHNNDSVQLREEMSDFEETLRVALNFAEQDGHTLVVVTADHETGGLVLTGGDIENGENTMKFNTQGHSGVMVPVFAFGPEASQFTGVHQNTDFFYLFCKLLGITL